MVGFQALAAVVALTHCVLAHPGENVEAIKHEMRVRNLAHAAASRSLAACQDTPNAVALRERTAARRAAKATELRAKRGISKSMFNYTDWFTDRADITSFQNLWHTIDGISPSWPTGRPRATT